MGVMPEIQDRWLFQTELIGCFGKNNEPEMEGNTRPKLIDQFGFSDNLLFQGENLDVLDLLLSNGFEGEVDLMYIDPPFHSNSKYHMKSGRKKGVDPVFDDFTGRDIDQYLDFLYERILLMRKILSETGSLFVHLDWHVSHYVKVMLDRIFGESKFRNEIIWHYYMGGKPRKSFARKHDSILFYTKTDKWKFNPMKVKRRLDFRPSLPSKSSDGKYIQSTVGKDEAGWFSRVSLDDVWDISGVFNLSREYTGFPTQKPLALLERIINSTTDEGDTVADLFSGSGTTLVAAERLNRNWIGCDSSHVSTELTLQRILSVHTGINSAYSLKRLRNTRKLIQQYSTDNSVETTRERNILQLLGAVADKSLEPFQGRRDDWIFYINQERKFFDLIRQAELMARAKDLGFSKICVVSDSWSLNRTDGMDAVEMSSGNNWRLVQLQFPYLHSTLGGTVIQNAGIQAIPYIIDKIDISIDGQTPSINIEDFILKRLDNSEFERGSGEIENPRSCFIEPRPDSEEFKIYSDCYFLNRGKSSPALELECAREELGQKVRLRLTFGDFLTMYIEL